MKVDGEPLYEYTRLIICQGELQIPNGDEMNVKPA